MADVIRVLIVDDDPLVRVGLATVLGAGSDIEVVGEAGDGAAGIAAAQRLRPDVVLMDIRMPGMDGLSATAALRARADGPAALRARADGPAALNARADGPAVIVLTTFDTDEHILRALRSGANGFLLKDTPPRDILDAVRRVAAGDSMLSPTVVARLIRHVVHQDDASGADARAGRAVAALGRLTEREREVAEAIGEGKSNAEISADLYMSVANVKAYVSRILTKLECANRVQVAILIHEARG